jgi:hypothetical protein
MRLRTRLQRLERNLVAAGCPACRDRRGLIVLRIVERFPDGSVAAEAEEPRPCVRCGQIPEQVMEVIETVVQTSGGAP